MSVSKPYAHAQYRKLVLVVVLVLRSKGPYCRILDYEYEIEYEYEPSLFMLVLGRESSSWDEMDMCCDNVKPENQN